jgi:hypothetical protein
MAVRGGESLETGRPEAPLEQASGTSRVRVEPARSRLEATVSSSRTASDHARDLLVLPNVLVTVLVSIQVIPAGGASVLVLAAAV